MQEKQMTIREKWESLTLADNFVFGKIMSNKDVCKTLLEMMLNIKITDIEYPEQEKTLQASYGARGIRMDVHTSDPERDFDIEMQTILRSDLSKRARYYQSLMDVEFLQKGNPYSSLKDNFVIFICLEDLFNKGLPVYSFENICAENSTIKLNDRSFKIFYNVSARDKIKNTELRDFF
ncbi:Rpn family recombination-promoting nuclease/putative transposase [Treponema sp.]|uniref:Rpn family recombination-promoting nuclease/putative transposase n=1 Tax=Treponema sp. TaxID=166 RepID=UPI00388F2925